jgi:hypothetical protein
MIRSLSLLEPPVQFRGSSLIIFLSRNERTAVSDSGFHGSRHLPAIYRNNLDHLIQHIPDRLIVEGAEFCTEVLKISPGAASTLEKVIAGRADQARRSRLAL